MELGLTWDERADAAYLYLTDAAASARQLIFEGDSQFGGEVIVDVDDDGRVLGIEFLAASRVLPEDILERAIKL